MDDYNPLYGSAAFRQANIELCLSIRPNFIMTLGGGLPCSPMEFERCARQFFNKVQRKALGRNWNKHPVHEQITAVGFREKETTNMHMHLVLHVTERMKSQLHRSCAVWKSIRIAGDYHTDILDNPTAYAIYITKEARKRTTAEEVFTYVPKPYLPKL